MFDIIGVGDADIDIMLKVDHIPGHDEKVLGQMLGKFPGGMVANYLSAAGGLRREVRRGRLGGGGRLRPAHPRGPGKTGRGYFPQHRGGRGRTPISQ